MQELQAHKIVRFITSQNKKELGLLPKSCGIFCHFDATLLLVMGYSNINEVQVMIALQVWVMVCLVSLVHSWFIHAPFWL